MLLPDPFLALERETTRIEAMLEGLEPSMWSERSACPGWTVADVVLHLAQTEEAVSATSRGEPFPAPTSIAGGTVDEIVDAWVVAERGPDHAALLDRWKAAHRDALIALRAADPKQAITWVAAPLRPATLATTRLSEHWIHALDIADPLGISFPDGDGLWHIARLAHRTLPYAFMRAGRDAPPSVRLELTSPGGEAWVFGDEDAACTVIGPAAEFCRVAARRLLPAEATRITAQGERADEVLELVRTYA